MRRSNGPTKRLGFAATIPAIWSFSITHKSKQSSGRAQYENMTGTVDNTCGVRSLETRARPRQALFERGGASTQPYLNAQLTYMYGYTNGIAVCEPPIRRPEKNRRPVECHLPSQLPGQTLPRGVVHFAENRSIVLEHRRFARTRVLHRHKAAVTVPVRARLQSVEGEERTHTRTVLLNQAMILVGCACECRSGGEEQLGRT